MKTNEYTIMTFNLLNGATKSGSYPDEYARREAVVTQIRESDPDTLGVQECTQIWYDILKEDLSDYEVVGELTNNERLLWRNAVFYRKSRFDPVDTGTIWLTETPNVMSKTRFSNQYRVMTYALLRDKETGKELVHCNTHMGFVMEEKDEQYAALLKKCDEFSCPLLLTGDFNAQLSHPHIGRVHSGGYISAYQLTEFRSHAPTCGNGVIDHCFVTFDKIKIISHDVLDGLVNGQDPSDHNAVVVRYSLKD